MHRPGKTLRSWRRGPGRRGARRATRAIVLAWVSAFAITFQCILLQAHFHIASASIAEAQPSSIEASATPAKADPAQKRLPPNEPQSGCFICQQLALDGVAVLPHSPAPVLAQGELGEAPANLQVATLAPPSSHIWRSRAPPLSLGA